MGRLRSASLGVEDRLPVRVELHQPSPSHQGRWVRGERRGRGQARQVRQSLPASHQRLHGCVVALLCQQLEPHACRSLPLGSSVLVPGLHLRVRQVELGGQLLPVLHREVFLLLKAALEGLQLVVAERRPCFPLLPLQCRLSRTCSRTVIFCKEKRGSENIFFGLFDEYIDRPSDPTRPKLAHDHI